MQPLLPSFQRSLSSPPSRSIHYPLILPVLIYSTNPPVTPMSNLPNLTEQYSTYLIVSNKTLYYSLKHWADFTEKVW